MKAARILQFGPPDVIVNTDIARPEPRWSIAGAGQTRRGGSVGRTHSRGEERNPTTTTTHSWLCFESFRTLTGDGDPRALGSELVIDGGISNL